MEIVKVIITKASKPTYWYANEVGQVFDCYPAGTFLEGKSGYQVVNDGKKFVGVIHFIMFEDCLPYDYIGRKPIKRLKFL